MTYTISATEFQSYQQNMIKEGRKVARKRKKTVKSIYLYYYEKRAFIGSFESNWYAKPDDCSNIYTLQDEPNEDKAPFFRFTLAGSSHTRQ